ncbi:MAG TPA: hypothetical protein V6D05_05030 [Stenomitos sp.]
MKKTLGLLALTVSLGAVGCAMLPHAAKAPASTATQTGYSLPGSAVLTNLPGAGYSAQAVGNGAKIVVARVYSADTAVGVNLRAASPSVFVDTATNKALAATASVVSGTANLTLPALPGGKYIIKLTAYDTLNHGLNATTWADGATSSYSVVAESEALVNASVGLPYTATFPVFSTFKRVYNVDASASATVGATTSVKISGLLPGTNGLFLRMANWNHYASLTASQTVRVTIAATLPYATNLASGSTAAYWYLGDIQSAKGFQATQSFPAWSWDSTRKYLYTDIPLTTGTYATDFATNSYSVKGLGSLSLALPSAFVPSGYSLSISDISSGSSNPGSANL